VDTSLKAGDYLRRNLANDFLHVHSGISDEIFLILLQPQDSSNVKVIQMVFEQMMQELAKDQSILLHVGISAIGKDLVNIHICYNQAHQAMKAYYIENTNTIGSYSLIAINGNQNIVDMEFVQRLYNLLLSGERATIEDIFHKILIKWEKNSFDYEMQRPQIFYSIRQIICNACVSSSILTETITIPVYQADATFEEVIDTLKKAAFELCDCQERNRHSKNTKLKESIIEYLNKHYNNSNLTAAIVCEEIGISEKYLYQFKNCGAIRFWLS
jgi:hypothetical protein